MSLLPLPQKAISSLGDTSVCSSCGRVQISTVERSAIPLYPPSIPLDGVAPQLYRYKDVDRKHDQIRLVILLPGAKTDEVCCLIITTALCSSPTYSAVSYTWATEEGDKSVLKRIYIADLEAAQTWQYLQVTINCENVLRQLRKTDKPQIIWIDSVCINQSSMDERNHQVGLMGRIYQRAKTVEMCIYNPTTDYRGAMGLLNVLLAEGQSVGKFDDCASANSSDIPIHIMHLILLFGCRYFERVWVIQEILLAATTNLHVNDEVVLLTWDKLDSAQETSMQFSVLIFRLQDWVLAWRRQTQSQGKTRIVSSLSMSLRSFCEDPKDHVFGILNLVPHRIRNLIAIDYNATEDQVFQQAVAACVFECGDLDILCFSELNAAFESASAPNFTKEQLRNFLRARDVVDGPSQPKGNGSTLRSPWLPQATADPHQLPPYPLSLQNVPEDVENSVKPPCPWPAREVPLAFRHEHQIPIRQLIPPLDVRAHLIDISIDCPDLSTEDLLRLVRRRPSRKWIGEFFQQPSELNEVSIFNSVDFRSFKNDMRIQSRTPSEGDRIFRTHYSIGCTSCMYSPGDFIFAIDGAHEPLILRPINPSNSPLADGDLPMYRIVGKCYLWAAMELNYWNPGSYKGIWKHEPYDLGREQTRMITIY
ncbi:hypothetical protein IQ07DRAFT_284143 [Pyrenochaeta sp. DS3sAY3a]|nr:hypothetical protein IQ07DRAFT_284143 [Pyrenochaeta sp. DS3sAY3a]